MRMMEQDAVSLPWIGHQRRHISAVIAIVITVLAGPVQLKITEVSACYGTSAGDCNFMTLECEAGTIIRIRTAKYGYKSADCQPIGISSCVDMAGCCERSKDDCTSNYTDLHKETLETACSGKRTCGPLQAPNNFLQNCDNSPILSTYVYVRYDCQSGDEVTTAIVTENTPITTQAPVTTDPSFNGSSTIVADPVPSSLNTGAIVAGVLVPSIVCILCLVAFLCYKRKGLPKYLKKKPKTPTPLNSYLDAGPDGTEYDEIGPVSEQANYEQASGPKDHKIVKSNTYQNVPKVKSENKLNTNSNHPPVGLFNVSETLTTSYDHLRPADHLKGPAIEYRPTGNGTGHVYARTAMTANGDYSEVPSASSSPAMPVKVPDHNNISAVDIGDAYIEFKKVHGVEDKLDGNTKPGTGLNARACPPTRPPPSPAPNNIANHSSNSPLTKAKHDSNVPTRDNDQPNQTGESEDNQYYDYTNQSTSHYSLAGPIHDSPIQSPCPTADQEGSDYEPSLYDYAAVDGDIRELHEDYMYAEGEGPNEAVDMRNNTKTRGGDNKGSREQSGYLKPLTSREVRERELSTGNLKEKKGKTGYVNTNVGKDTKGETSAQKSVGKLSNERENKQKPKQANINELVKLDRPHSDSGAVKSDNAEPKTYEHVSEIKGVMQLVRKLQDNDKVKTPKDTRCKSEPVTSNNEAAETKQAKNEPVGSKQTRGETAGSKQDKNEPIGSKQAKSEPTGTKEPVKLVNTNRDTNANGAVKSDYHSPKIYETVADVKGVLGMKQLFEKK